MYFRTTISNMLEQFLQLLHDPKTFLENFAQQYPMLIYVVVFMIIFIETGLVFFPFLPGDSLIFALGVMAAVGKMNPFIVFGLLFTAAVLGNILNNFIGRKAGDVIIKGGYIKQHHLTKTHDYFEKYGSITIVYARFLPFVRTFAPFVAGVAKMPHSVFHIYNVIGAFLWTGLFFIIGYLLGNVEYVQNNFSTIVLFIIVSTGLFAIVPIARHYFKRNTN